MGGESGKPASDSESGRTPTTIIIIYIPPRWGAAATAVDSQCPWTRYSTWQLVRSLRTSLVDIPFRYLGKDDHNRARRVSD